MKTLIQTAFVFTALTAQSAFAEEVIIGNWSCSFTKECFEQESCADTDYEVSVTYEIDGLKDKPGEGAGTGSISDVTGDKKAVIAHDKGTFVATALDMTSDKTINSTFKLFSSSSGEARLVSVDPSAPMLITYHGQCEANDS